MMEAVSISETSVNFYQTTWRNISDFYCSHNIVGAIESVRAKQTGNVTQIGNKKSYPKLIVKDH
jgi:hypothetical protein